MIVKIAPDIAEDDLPAIVARLVAHKVDGIAVSNTTLARTGLTDAHRAESGGLSGRPLFHRVDDRAGPRLPGDRRAIPADRHRRHRQSGARRSPRSKPAPRCCSSIPASSTRARRSSAHQGHTSGGTRRSGTTSLANPACRRPWRKPCVSGRSRWQRQLGSPTSGRGAGQV